MNHVVKQLRHIRRESQLTQQEVGRRMGVTKEAICQWETGARTPSPSNIARWAEALGVEIVLQEKANAA